MYKILVLLAICFTLSYRISFLLKPKVNGTMRSMMGEIDTSSLSEQKYIKLIEVILLFIITFDVAMYLSIIYFVPTSAMIVLCAIMLFDSFYVVTSLLIDVTKNGLDMGKKNKDDLNSKSFVKTSIKTIILFAIFVLFI